MLTEIDARTDSEKRGIVRPATIFSRAAVAPRRELSGRRRSHSQLTFCW